MTEAKLVILRHGQTDYNAQHLMTGQRDIPLNETGLAQARAVGPLIKDIPFDKVYSSYLSRAFNTASLALESSGTHKDLKNKDGSWKIEKRAEIIELDVGDFTGKSRKDDPKVANLQQSYEWRWPNGESVKDLVDRVQKFYDAEIMPRLERGENVFVVAHSVVLYAFQIVMGIAEPPKPEKIEERKKVPNAAPFVCEFEDGVLKKNYYIENPVKPPANQNQPAQVPAKKAVGAQKHSHKPGL